MNIVYFISAIISAIVSAAYLQLPTFILPLSYQWFHNFKIKRWVIRLISISFFVLFIISTNSPIVITLGAIPIAFFLIFSLVNANPKVYISLADNQILKLREAIYPPETEVLGFDNEQGHSICYPLYEILNSSCKCNLFG